MYDLPVHRYRELKHFCLQYDFMKEEINRLQNQLYLNEEDPTGYIAVKLTEYKNAVKLIETTAFNLGKFPGEKILKMVTKDTCIGSVCSDDIFNAKFYLRKFFWMLSEAKGM